jgi:Glycosyltransferase family 9 (heptosyltransferase)
MTAAHALGLMAGLVPSMLRVVRKIQQGGFPNRIWHHGITPGDNLLLATACREMRKRRADKIWVLSPFPEFFPKSDVAAVLPISEVAIRFLWRTGRLPRPELLSYGRDDRKLQRTFPLKRHIIAEVCAQAGLTGEIALRTSLELTHAQKQEGRIAPNQIAIQSSGLAASFPMRNKEWFVERFQKVIRCLGASFTIIQLGSKDDPRLDGVRDLRGKTSPIQAAAVISASKLFIGLEGFLAHLARAVDTRSVIIYGGRTPPEHSGYICNENLFTPMPCAPCWQWSSCEFDRACMKQITVERVVRACYVQLEKFGYPLEVATDWLEPAT